MTDVREAELYRDIYDVLEACTNNELAPIVDALLRAPVSVFKISRAFERHNPDHVRYTDQVGDEMYRLSLMALGRSNGKRPSYEDLLMGLCKQIGIPAAPNDINEKEGILLNIFSKQHLSSCPASERQGLVEEACVAASMAAAGMLSSDAWPPFASFLVQVAYLRRKLLEEGRIAADPPNKTKEVLGRVPAVADDDADALVVQTEDGHPIVSLVTLTEVGNEGWRGPEDSRKALNVLTPILKAIQPYFSAEQMLKGDHVYRAKVALSWSEKAQAFVGSAKTIKGQVPFEAVTIASVANPAAILILASAYMEQKKLENIEKSLDEIKSSLKDVSKFQQNERRSILTGSIRYFRQVSSSVLTGELVNEVLHEIERHEVELVRVQEHFVEDIRSQVGALRAIKKESWGAGKFVSAIQEAQTILERMYDEVLLCIRARACGYQLLCAYPGRDAGKRARLEDIRKALSLFLPTGEATIAMDQALRAKIQGASSYESKALLLSKENALFDRIGVEITAIFDGLRDAEREASEPIDPFSIDIRMQNGVAVAVRTS